MRRKQPIPFFSSLPMLLLYGFSILVLVLLFGAGCANDSNLSVYDQANTSPATDQTQRSQYEGDVPTPQEEREPTQEETWTQLQKKFDAVMKLVADFEANIKANPEMTTKAQRNIWENGIEKMQEPKADVLLHLKELKDANETSWKTHAVEAQRAIQEFAALYITTKFQVLGITEEDLEHLKEETRDNPSP